MRTFFLAGVFLLSLSSFSLADKIPVKIGVLAYRGPDEAIKSWESTADYLSARISGYSFSIVPLNFREINTAVEQKKVDFVLANSSIYVELEAFYRISRLATMKNLGPGKTRPTVFGGVIFSRSDRNDIRNLNDLKGRSFMAVDETSLGGWRVAWRQFRKAGIDPYLDFDRLIFGRTHDAVVYAVRDREVDAGTVRTDILERMETDGKINLKDFRILNQQTHDDFPFVSSTDLYPEWPFAKLRHTPNELAEKVAIALLSMSEQDPAARHANIAGWTIPFDYQPVHDVLKELRVGPYRDYGKITPRELIRQYYGWIGFAVLLSMVMAAFIVYVSRINRQLQVSRVELEKAHNTLELKVQERTAELEEVKQDWEDTFNTITDMITVHDGDFNIIRSNKAAEKILGLPDLNVSRAKCFQYYHGKGCPPELCPSCETLKTGVPAFSEIFEKNLNMFLEIRAIPRIDSHNRMIGLIHVARDITNRKKAEKALYESESKFKSFSEQALVGIYLIQDNVFKYVNPKFAEMFGYSVEELYRDIPFEKLVSPEDAPFVEEQVRKRISGALPYSHHEFRGFRKNNEVIYLEAFGATTVYDNKPAAIGTILDISERKKAEDRISRQIQKLSALRAIDLAISTSLDIRVTLKIFIEQVVTQLGVDAANVLLLNPHTRILEYAASQGFRTSALRHAHVRLGEGLAGVAALENRIVSVPDLNEKESGSMLLARLEDESFITYYGVPLVVKGHVMGVLEIFHRNSLAPDEEWFEFLDGLALQAAIAIDNNSLFYDLERTNLELTLAYDSTIEGWSRALDYRDKETEGHSQRVSEMTLRIAREMGMTEEDLVNVRRGALLHDIGKMGIPDNILLKQGPHTVEERDVMRQHTVYAYELLSPIVYLRPALDIPYCHHERWDGTGYPRGLKGEQIPLSARIFAVVDVWDALRSDRPYRPAWTEEKTKEYILSSSGTHFDPRAVELFAKLMGFQLPEKE